ncbi:aspartoacylase [Legionella massiliensis]|uniref:Aspartoacylase n=1 Tax=Legionella massiliensis TaxID=1034943 RepID=A0A078L0I2_9GAMM|nr:succinylglutamate desuccinylase/aspartoacylase family protein [Legionella massiliensis]CDZ77508.1 aspartoacylase [Legionella massiliensis]CEE13246.1 aspartoacylase [Legionella massiliensis]
MNTRKSITIANEEVNAGESRCVKLAVAMLYTSTPLEIPVYVSHGKKDGPVLFITAAIHGDEINGVEIIRRLHHAPQIKRLRGTLITIPIVNIYGLMLHSRYLPDRRDLNRQFPGSERGSMASKLANLLMTEIVKHSTHGIDLHTGAIHRSNYPQVRFSEENPISEQMAEAFATPVIVPSNIRDGSLRYATDNLNIPVIVYEAGEALRFDEFAIKLGLRGILRVMAYLGMLSPSQAKHIAKKQFLPAIAKSTFWIRAQASGMMVDAKPQGYKIDKGELLCSIVDPLGDNKVRITCPYEGLIIGRTNIPLVNEGDALFHVALFEDLEGVQLPTDNPDDWD